MAELSILDNEALTIKLMNDHGYVQGNEGVSGLCTTFTTRN